MAARRAGESPGMAKLRERDEGLAVAALSLHAAAHRGAISREAGRLPRNSTNFGLQHHRLLWAAISEREEGQPRCRPLEAINRGRTNPDDLAGSRSAPAPRRSVCWWSRASCPRYRLTPSGAHRTPDHETALAPLHAVGVGTTACWSASVASSVARHLLDAWSGPSGWKTLERWHLPCCWRRKRTEVRQQGPFPQVVTPVLHQHGNPHRQTCSPISNKRRPAVFKELY